MKYALGTTPSLVLYNNHLDPLKILQILKASQCNRSSNCSCKIYRSIWGMSRALDKEAWGFDHGSWGVLIKMYPDADIPMVQLSIDSSKPAAWHFEMGRKLAALRDEGIMLVASGNVVHNLRTVKWHGDSSPYPWAMSFNEYVKANLTWQGAVEQHPLVNYLDHEGGALSNPTPEHYLPLLYVLGAWDGQEPITIPVDGIEMGSLSMLSVQIG